MLVDTILKVGIIQLQPNTEETRNTRHRVENIVEANHEYAWHTPGEMSSAEYVWVSAWGAGNV